MKRLAFLLAYFGLSLALTVGAANQLSPSQQDSVAQAQAQQITNIVNGVVNNLPFVPSPLASLGYALASAFIGAYFYLRGHKHGSAAAQGQK